MAVYKVPQDVEAEDKLVGPLTARRLIYVFLAGAIGFVAYQFMNRLSIYLGLLFVPPLALFLVLGLWPSQHQPIEVYLQALVRFYFKNHTRVWQQTGIVDRVTIHVPKQVNRQLTDTRDEYSVEANLKKIANLMNSRGWNQRNLREDPYSLAPSHRVVDQHMEGIFAEGSQTSGAFGQALNDQAAQQQAQLQAMANGQASTYQPATGSYVGGYQAAQQPAPAQQGYVDPRLAQNGDLSVASIARQANQQGVSL